MSKPPISRPKASDGWRTISLRFLPFADAATESLPLGRLLRLSLFQVTAGMAVALLTGTVNRVMIVELGVPAWLVALMVSLPLVFAPLRALIGHKSDTHVSVLGWRRAPYIWFGSLLMFGGLAIMPFALLILSGDTHGPAWIGQFGAALSFLLLGAGLHTVQTAGLALATDLAPAAARPRVVALLYVMLLVGMGVSALAFGWLLADFSQLRLIKVIQGSAVVAIVLNVVALWQQEARQPALTAAERDRDDFSDAFRALVRDPQCKRLLVAVGLGAAAFGMQDILLEPYGGEVLGMGVGETTRLTAIFAVGTLMGLALAARWLGQGAETHRLAAFGALIGIPGFSMVVFAGPLESVIVFQCGTFLIGLGGGLFSVCTLTAAMALTRTSESGLALGAWGAVQATAAGAAVFLGGAIRDIIQTFGDAGVLGAAFERPAMGYSVVYHIEIALLFATLAVIGPLARFAPPRSAPLPSNPANGKPFGLPAFPG
ncbi:MAG: BCD family MFS transporter [Pseudomonadota bacterium]